MATGNSIVYGLITCDEGIDTGEARELQVMGGGGGEVVNKTELREVNFFRYTVLYMGPRITLINIPYIPLAIIRKVHEPGN